MSIPDRLVRLAKGKAGELKNYLDHLGEQEELSPEEEAKLVQSQARKVARKELDEAMDDPFPTSKPVFKSKPQEELPRAAARPRTPDEISGRSSTPATPVKNSEASNQSGDPLTPQFRLLGLEPGSDYGSVQSAYVKLEERCRPGRFAEGTPEATELEDIRKRLEKAYHDLQAALDPTARRFDLLDI